MFVIVLLHVLDEGSDSFLSLGAALSSLRLGLGRVLDSLVSFDGGSLVLGAFSLNSGLCFNSGSLSLCTSLLGFGFGNSFLSSGSLCLLFNLSLSNLCILLRFLGGGLCLKISLL